MIWPAKATYVSVPKYLALGTVLPLHKLVFYPSSLKVKEGPACWTLEFILLTLSQMPLFLEVMLELCVPCVVSTNCSVLQLLNYMKVSLTNLWTPFLHHLWLFHFWASSTEISEWCTTGVQFSSVAQSCPTLCDPMNSSTPGLPVHHQLLESTQTHVH